MVFDIKQPNTSDSKDPKGIERNSRVRPYNAIQLHFLLLLVRLLTLRRERAATIRADDWRSKLLNKATFSAYCDCIDLGVMDDALSLIQREIGEHHR
jgi:hypothetical protein